MLNAKIKVYICQGCSKTVSFDGTKSGYLNYDNKLIIPIEKIINYMDLFSARGLPFSTWWKSSFDIQLTPEQLELPIYKKNRDWNKHTGLLHEAFVMSTELLQFPIETFKCCESPKAITMDGCVISMKSSRLPELKHPWINGIQEGQASVRRDRQLPRIFGLVAEDVRNCIKGEIVNLHIVQNWRDSDHCGLICLSFCMVEIEKNRFRLHERAKLFAESLMKLIAPACGLLPNKCRHIAEK